MSVAYELDFAEGAPVETPVRRRLAAVPDCAPGALPGGRARSQFAPSGPVAVLHPLDDSQPLRLTRRGIAVLTLAIGAIGAAVVAIAAHSAPAAPLARAAGPAVVTVRSGDTLWSIASVAAPTIDPRAEITTIQTLNHLHGAALVPGQHLRVR